MSDYREIECKEVTVRKPHSCEWCAHRIEKGEKAQSRTYHWDGNLQTGRMHPECWTAFQTYPDPQDLNDGWMPGDFGRGSHSDSSQQYRSQP